MSFRIVKKKVIFLSPYRKGYINGYFSLPKKIRNWKIILGTNKIITIQELCSHPM